MKVHLVPRNGGKPIVSLATEIDTATDAAGIGGACSLEQTRWHH